MEKRSGGAGCPIDRRESCFGVGPFGDSFGVRKLERSEFSLFKQGLDDNLSGQLDGAESRSNRTIW